MYITMALLWYPMHQKVSNIIFLQITRKQTGKLRWDIGGRQEDERVGT